MNPIADASVSHSETPQVVAVSHEEMNMPSIPIPAQTNVSVTEVKSVPTATETASEENKETKEKESSDNKEENYTMLGNATITPCGPGVISQVLEDGRAVVILLASEGSSDVTRLATGVFHLDMLRKPDYEKEPSSIRILRSQVYRDLGDSLMQAKEYRNAVFLYQNAINIINDDLDEDYRVDGIVIVVTCLSNMCSCFLVLGDLENAERIANQAYSIAPTFEKAAINMATIHVSKHKMKEALEVIQKALQANPQSQALMAIFNKILDMTKEEEELKAKTTSSLGGSSLSSLFNSSRQNQAPAAGAAGNVAAMPSAMSGAMSSAMPADASVASAAPEEKSEEDEEDEALANTIFWASLAGVAAVAFFMFRRWRH